MSDFPHSKSSLILLHTVVLSFTNGPNIFKKDAFPAWGQWTDWALLVIFIIYTAETVVKIVAFGLWDDSQLVIDEGLLRNVKRSFKDWFNKDMHAPLLPAAVLCSSLAM